MLPIVLTFALALTPSPSPVPSSTAPVPATGSPTAAPHAIDLTPAMATRLDEALRRLVGHGDGQAPGLAVAIAQHGRIVYDGAFGNAQHGSRFRIASITKMFTAVAIMQLVEAGKIDLDATVATYLPAVPHAKEITIRELLQHRSGLWNFGDEAFATGAVVTRTTPLRILALAATHPLTAPPGTQYTYSNTGYVLLGLVVEHVAGQPLAAYERTHIFDIADMRDTTFDGPGVAVIPGYLSAAGKTAPAFDPSWTFAVGNIVSTAGDLARFDIALLAGKLVATPTLALMQANPIPVSDSHGLSQGLGMTIAAVPGLRFFGHHGGIPGFAAENETEPDDALSMVVLGNASDFITASANLRIVEELYPGVIHKGAAFATSGGYEDVFVTARFRTTLEGLFDGTIDRSQYTPEMNAAMTDELLARTANQLQTLGSITSVSYVGTEKLGNQTVYRYRVTFGGETSLPWLFSIAADGKISGIRLAQ